jgi:hypothetical protein
VDKLLSIGFIPSLIDDCLLFRDGIIFMVYIDDGIFLGSNDLQFLDIIRKSKNWDLTLKIKATLPIM